MGANFNQPTEAIWMRNVCKGNEGRILDIFSIEDGQKAVIDE